MSDSNSSKATQSISALILAAGKGTRMKSSQPKVLHPILGKPMLEWVIDAVKKAGASDLTLVLSSETKPFENIIKNHADSRIVIQKKQRGTGDAVASAAEAYKLATTPAWAEASFDGSTKSSSPWILICAGDTPAMSSQTIKNFITEAQASSKRLAVLGMNVNEPRGYGRLVRASDGGLARVVEERDATAEERKLTLCNSGVIFSSTEWLFELLGDITPNNSQNEFYLTDIFEASALRGESAYVFQTDSSFEFAGVNDRSQLSAIENSLLHQRRTYFMNQGVTFHLPDTVYIEADVSIESDCRIFPGTCLKGSTRISRNCTIGASSIIEDSVFGAGVVVGSHAIVKRCRISAGKAVPAQALLIDAEI